MVCTRNSLVWTPSVGKPSWGIGHTSFRLLPGRDCIGAQGHPHRGWPHHANAHTLRPSRGCDDPDHDLAVMVGFDLTGMSARSRIESGRSPAGRPPPLHSDGRKADISFLRTHPMRSDAAGARVACRRSVPEHDHVLYCRSEERLSRPGELAKPVLPAGRLWESTSLARARKARCRSGRHPHPSVR